MLGTVEGFAFGKVGFAFYLTDRVGPSNIVRKLTSNCSTEPDIYVMYVMYVIHVMYSMFLMYYIYINHYLHVMYVLHVM